MGKNFLNLVENTNLEITEAQQTPHRVNINESSSRHIIVKTLFSNVTYVSLFLRHLRRVILVFVCNQ